MFRFVISNAFGVLLFFTGILIVYPIGSGSASTKPFEALTSDDLDQIDPNLKSKDEKTESEATQPKLWRFSDDERRIVKLKVILDREGFSPGAINSHSSSYFNHILKIYEKQTGVALFLLGETEIDELLAQSGGEEFKIYELTAKDVSGPFTRNIPERIQDQSSLKRLNYKTAREAVAERFHMDETFLARLNPTVDFSSVGSKVKVTNIGRYLDRWVSRIRADKNLKQVTAFDQNGEILAVYPASIGSEETPSPKGSFTVRNKAGFPAYTLSPQNGFEKVEGNRQIIIAPGPNNPVGSAWIGLSKKTYGIHGTPEPSNIGRAESHGCIRLTNWDALELTRLVRTGIEVVIE